MAVTNYLRDLQVPEEAILEAVAFPIGRSVALDALPGASSGALPVIAPDGCVGCCDPVSGSPDQPLPRNAAGWAFVGFASSLGSAVVFVRQNLTRGVVTSALRTRALFRRDVADYDDRPVWLVHVDPRRRIGQPLSDDDLYAPFCHVEDPTWDLPLLGPLRHDQLLPPIDVLRAKRQLLRRHRRNTVKHNLPRGYDRPSRPVSDAPWIPKLS
jgi:hypothetical protein